MRHVPLVLLVFGLVPFSQGFAQEATNAKDDAREEAAQTVRMVVVDIGERKVEPGGKIEVPDTQRLHVFDGRRPGIYYFVVRLRRTIPANAQAKLDDASALLTFGTSPPARPYAVALQKNEMADDATAYKVTEKRRLVYETYYFPVGEGQYEWTVRVNDKALGKVADYFTKLIVVNSQRSQARVTLPSGAKEVLRANRREDFMFPSGKQELLLEVRGHAGKIKTPWKRYKKGEVRFLQMVGELRQAPMLPVAEVRKALPKIALAYKLYHKKKGISGGGYNIAPRGEPVRVYIEFGRDGEPGGIYKIRADTVTMEFDEKGDTIRISERHNRWEIVPWDKTQIVEISKDGTKAVGEVRSGHFVIRATKRRQAVFDNDGMLKKGVLFDTESSAYYQVDLVQQKDKLVIVYATQTKEPK